MKCEELDRNSNCSSNIVSLVLLVIVGVKRGCVPSAAQIQRLTTVSCAYFIDSLLRREAYRRISKLIDDL
jgi:hypothetical protein